MTARRLGLAGIFAALVAVVLFVANKITKGHVWTFLNERTAPQATG